MVGTSFFTMLIEVTTYITISKRLRKLFNIILRESNLSNITRENGADVIEARGISDQGVKLPFSINRKNTVEYKKINNWEDWENRQEKSKGNYCFLINQYGCEIDTLEKILSMQKIDSKKVLEIINDFEEDIAFKHDIDNNTFEEFKELTQEINVQAFVNNIDEINASIKTKLDKHIEAKQRNKTLLQIAVLNKSEGMTAEENERIRGLLNIDGKTINKGLQELERLNKIIFVRKGERDEESTECRNSPNIYTLDYKLKASKDDKSYKLLCGKDENKNCKVTYVNFEMMCAKALSKEEIKKYFGNHSQILKYKYQKLQEIS